MDVSQPASQPGALPVESTRPETNAQVKWKKNGFVGHLPPQYQGCRVGRVRAGYERLIIITSVIKVWGRAPCWEKKRKSSMRADHVSLMKADVNGFH